MKALVTGGCGLIGSHIADALVARGDEVTALDSLESPPHPRLGNAPPWKEYAVPRLRIADVNDRFAVRNAVEGADVVFHQAAIGGFSPQPARMTEANCLGTAIVIEEAARAGVRKVVVASSQAVYGHGVGWCPEDSRVPVGGRDPELLAKGKWEPICPVCRKQFLEPAASQEADPPNPASVYGWSKLYTEKVALQLGEDLGIPVVALRYALTYGPRQSPHNPYAGIVSIFSTRMLNGNPPILFEDGKQKRDFTYVEDVADANLLVADNRQADGRAFNVGTGGLTTVGAVVNMLADIYREAGKDVPEATLVGEYRPTDARHVFVDPVDLKRLGWQPKTAPPLGLEKFAEWFLTQPLPPDPWYLASEHLKRTGVVRSVA